MFQFGRMLRVTVALPVLFALALTACSNEETKSRGRNKGNDPNPSGAAAGPPSGGGDTSELDESAFGKLQPEGDRLIVLDPRDGTERETTLVRGGERTLITDSGSSAVYRDTIGRSTVPGAYVTLEGAGGGLIADTDSLSPTVYTDYGISRVIEPDPTYVHIQPQDRMDPILTGGFDPNPDTGVSEFVYTDFGNDLIMYTLRTLANSWGSYRGQPMDMGASIRELIVEPQAGSNQVVVAVKIQADGVFGGEALANGQRIYRVELEGTMSAQGRRITLRQISNPEEDGGYRFQAYVTCMDVELGSCDTSIVVIEQISEHNEICKRGIAIYRNIGAQLQMDDDLFTQVNCGQFPDQYPAAKRFMSYMANTVHSYRIRKRVAVPAQCSPVDAQVKIPHMEETRARSFAAANGYAFVHIEGIESDYDYTRADLFELSDGSNPAAHLFDDARDWFRFWGQLKRDTPETSEVFRHELRFYGDSMPRGAHSGMTSPMASTISQAVLEGNDGRGHLSILLNFTDGYSTELEFLGISKRYLSPEGMRFYPFQGREVRAITEYPVPFPEEFKGM